MPDRPLVSAIMPLFRHERHVGEAFASMLAQDYEPLEIVVVDNCSTDRSFAIVEEMTSAYRGPHRITLHRNERNIFGNSNNVLMQLSTGAFLVVFHSDDVARVDRVSRLVAVWQETGALLLASNGTLIDDNGLPLRPFFEPGTAFRTDAKGIAAIGYQRGLHGATFAHTRAVMEHFPPWDAEWSPTQTDIIVPFRAALLGRVHIVDEPLLSIRTHPATVSWLVNDAGITDPQARREGVLAAEMGQVLALLAELNHPTGRAAAGPRFGKLQDTLLVRLASLGGRWTRVRNRMLMRDLLPNWGPRVPVPASPPGA
ncbi:MAG: glycosyltransferase family 2 protein [Alphaproteobacteria bacterium]